MLMKMKDKIHFKDLLQYFGNASRSDDDIVLNLIYQYYG